MMEELIQAAAARLKELWPGCTVYDQAIPQNAPGAYYVGVKSAEQTAGLDRRRRQKVELEVRYYLPGEQAAEFGQWAQAMLDGFRVLTGPQGGKAVLKQRAALPDSGEGYYAFRCVADLCYTQPPEEAELMQQLYQKIGKA